MNDELKKAASQGERLLPCSSSFIVLASDFVSRSARDFAGLRVDADGLALLDEERDADFEAGL